MFKILSEFFDNEINLPKRIYFEAIMVRQSNFQICFRENMFELYKISQSIQRVKNKISNQHQCHFL